jgi:translation elongation factor P/translation initiation factor 5A
MEANFYFMNPDTYEQIPVERVALGDAVDFLRQSGSATYFR